MYAADGKRPVCRISNHRERINLYNKIHGKSFGEKMCFVWKSKNRLGIMKKRSFGMFRKEGTGGAAEHGEVILWQGR